MIRGARPGARKLALFAVILGVAGGLALGIIGCVQGVDDADKYGRVALPGSEVLDLPEGEIALYYEERVTLAENDSLDSPDGIRVVAQRENERVRSEKRGVSNAISLDGRALDEWGKIEIPQAGRWRVTARSREQGSNQPAVTLGTGQTENFVDAGLTFALLSGAGLGAALLILVFGRIGYTRPTPHELAAAMPRTAPAPAASAAPWVPTQAVPSAPPAPAAGTAPATGGDPVEVQLRDLERRHAAGEMDEAEYQRQRRAVLDAAFRRPGG